MKPPVTHNDQQAGNPDAPFVLVEYGDYQCTHCGHAYPLIKRLLEEKGKDLLFVFRNFPLQESHPAAYPAALAAEAAGKQGKFWPMHDMIYEHQENLHGDSFMHFADALELDPERFLEDAESEILSQKVDADFESGVRSGVNGTPTFFINGEMLAYDGTYASLLAAVQHV